MEQNTFNNFNKEKLQIPEVNFGSTLTSNNEIKKSKSDTLTENILKDNFTARHCAVAIFLICLIILFVFFINGMSVYKSNTFID